MHAEHDGVFVTGFGGINRLADIAVVDDDREIRELLSAYLERNNFTVAAFASGEDYLAISGHPYKALILDIGLPGINGLELCKFIRSESELPILMLTAADDDVDRILGLELGADDYLGKPFNPRELLARLRARLRRAPELIDTHKLCVKSAARSAYWDGEKLNLTGLEFELLRCLDDARGEILSRKDLNQAVKGRPLNPYDRSIDTAISRLRLKLAEAGACDVVQSVRGKGYVLVDQQ